MAKAKQRYGIYNVRVYSTAYASVPQVCSGAILPPRAATRCFATVTPLHTNVIRYLCGDGEDAKVSRFHRTDSRPGARSSVLQAPNRGRAPEQALRLLRAPRTHTGQRPPYGCCGLLASAAAGRACRITNQSLSFKEQRSCGVALPSPPRDCAAPQSRSL